MSQRPERPPVRLCCFQRHYGAQCPDGTVMCCLCFQLFPVAMLSVDDCGDPIDVCLSCAADKSEPAVSCPKATAIPKNVEEPSLMQVVFNSVEKARTDRRSRTENVDSPTPGGDT